MTVTASGPDSYSMEQNQAGKLLSVWTEQQANRCTLRLRGRLTGDTAADFNTHVDRLGCRWCDEIVIDVSGLECMDQVGARLLVGLSHYVAARGGTFRTVGARPVVSALMAAAEVELS